MGSVWRMKKGLVSGLAVLGLLVVPATRQLEARPAYQNVFNKKYEEVVQANDVKKTVRCNVCHIGKIRGKEKEWNVYGKAVASSLSEIVGKTGIPEAGVKDVKQIEEALTKTESVKSAVEGKTFGDLLKAKQLPVKIETKEEKK